MADILLKKDWIEPQGENGEGPRLLGATCTKCGYCCFPPKPVCTKCLCEDCMEKTELSRHAVLETFAVMQVGPPDIPLPYIVGYVRTKEGALIFTMITGCEIKEDALHLGQDMELVLETIKQDDQGNNLIGWKFKPAAGEVK